MKLPYLAIGLVLVFASSVNVSSAQCPINLDSRSASGKPHPLILQNDQFIYPSGSRVITIAHHATVQYVCHGPASIPSYIEGFPNTGPQEPTLTLVCSNGGFVKHDGAVVDVNPLRCSGKNEPKIKRTPGSSCSKEGSDGRKTNLSKITSVVIGWEINNKFIEQIRICLDELTYATLWSRHEIIGPAIEYKDITGTRPSFKKDVTGESKLFPDFPNQTALAFAYTKASQQKTAEDIYGPSGKNLIDISKSGTHYFAKGHISPDAAFVYEAFQNATYYYVNVAPQFQSFNNGNWKKLEAAARSYASGAQRTIEVYTGTYGYLKYNINAAGLKTFFLYNKNNHDWIPAPEVFWKVIHDPGTKEAVAFVGLNNPYATAKPSPPCKDICHKITWANWDMNNKESGFMWCCDVGELRSKIPYIPI